MLAGFFLERFNSQLGRDVRGFSNDAEKLLFSYEWPGNVREMENRIMRAVIMSDDAFLTPAALGFSGERVEGRAGFPAGQTLKDVRDSVERELVSEALRKHGGNMAKSAESLGVSRTNLYDLVRKHGLVQVAGGTKLA